jgi:hypothetical protein
MGGSVVQNPAVQAALNPIKLYVRAVGRKLLPQFPHQMTKNYCVWSVLAREISKEERRIRKFT